MGGCSPSPVPGGFVSEGKVDDTALSTAHWACRAWTHGDKLPPEQEALTGSLGKRGKGVQWQDQGTCGGDFFYLSEEARPVGAKVVG